MSDGVTRGPDGTVRYGVYVGNIDSSISVDALKQAFSVCGPIVEASLNGAETNPYRFGFIDFATDEARQKALGMNGYTLSNRTIKVNLPATRGGTSAINNTGIRGTKPVGGIPPPAPAPLAAPTTPDPVILRSIILAMQANGQLMPGAQPTPEQLQMIQAAAMLASNQQHAAKQREAVAAAGGGSTMFVAVNPRPTAEELEMREAQKLQYFAAVRKCAENYEAKKLQRVLSKSNRSSSSSGSSSSSSSSDEDDDNTASANAAEATSGSGPSPQYSSPHEGQQ